MTTKAEILALLDNLKSFVDGLSDTAFEAPPAVETPTAGECAGVSETPPVAS